MTLSGRKAEHLQIAAGGDVAHRAAPGWSATGCATGRCPSATWPTSRSRPTCSGRGSARRSSSRR